MVMCASLKPQLTVRAILYVITAPLKRSGDLTWHGSTHETVFDGGA